MKNDVRAAIAENPVLVLFLGSCPAMAASTSVISALGMGAAVLVVMLLSNMLIYALRNAIPKSARLSANILIITAVVSAVQMLMNALLPNVYQMLGVYLAVVAVNLLLEDSNDPVIWRGPVIAGTVKQFWTDVVWKDVDYMIVDMPPGTGDVPLTVFQSLPVDGIVIVTSPQELVSMIVGKAVRMAKMMNVPILGIIENMSYVECPDCGKHINIFGESHVDEVAKQYDLPVLGRIPMTAEIAAASDAGNVEGLEGDWFNDAVAAIEGLK